MAQYLQHNVKIYRAPEMLGYFNMVFKSLMNDGL